MEDNELLNLWKSYDQKLEQVLLLNKQLTFDLTKNKLNKTINKLGKSKNIMLLIGVPYILLLYFITFIGYQAGGIFVTMGFGTIALIMTMVVTLYFYQIYLISEINSSYDVVTVQEKLSKLKISSFNATRLTIIQLPFWSICWMSLNALKNSPLVYGGVNLVIFLGLSYFAYWLYKSLDIQNLDTEINKFFFSGSDWEPIIKSSEILEQLKEYKN